MCSRQNLTARKDGQQIRNVKIDTKVIFLLRITDQSYEARPDLTARKDEHLIEGVKKPTEVGSFTPVTDQSY
ncbi:hypothetical protein R5M08_003995 [Providencia rettgeri]|nr:hypothetical protein [Providencia rettgeri]ELR5243714.1 hypothetical protein [Providencia rettgeri]ELS4585799.1 hypothetical protein [Providencia rettgeri]